MNIEKRIITNNFTSGRNGWNIDFIVPHSYNGRGDDLYNWWQTNDRNVSAHFCVLKDGRVIQYVELENTAHHAGNIEANYRSVGVEFQDDGNPSDSVRTNEQYESGAQLFAYIYRLRGWNLQDMGQIRPHREFTDTGCPGSLDIDRLKNRVYEILNPPAPVIEPPKVDNYYRWLVDGVQKGAFLEKENAFNFWYGSNGIITFQNKDITLEFKNMATKLEEEIKLKATEIENQKLEIQSLKTKSEALEKDANHLSELNKKLEEEIKTYNAIVKLLGSFKVIKNLIITSKKP